MKLHLYVYVCIYIYIYRIAPCEGIGAISPLKFHLVPKFEGLSRPDLGT